MAFRPDHTACVDAWLRRAVEGQASAQQLAAFEEAVGALWKRAHRTLGDVTLGAIVERVLHVAAGQNGALALRVDALRIDAGGVRFDPLPVAPLLPGQLPPTFRFVLAELLTVIGNLTGDILTPPLHAELARLPRRVEARDAGGPKGGSP